MYRPIDPNPWDKRIGEPPKAFAAFAHYRDAGPGRKLTDTVWALKLPTSTPARWSRQYEWKARCDHYDRYMDQLQTQEQARVRMDDAKWLEQTRRADSRENKMIADKLRKKGLEMMDRALDKEVGVGPNGEVIMEPARWTMETAARYVKTADELMQSAISTAGGLLAAQDDGFDEKKASIEQLREYIAKHGAKADE